MTAVLLTEKALQGSVSAGHQIGLRGKFRLYALWMTEASWKDPTFKTRNVSLQKGPCLKIRGLTKAVKSNPTRVWHDRVGEVMRPHVGIDVWCLGRSQSTTDV